MYFFVSKALVRRINMAILVAWWCSAAAATSSHLHPVSGGVPTALQMEKSLNELVFNGPVKRQDFNRASWAFITAGIRRPEFTLQWMLQNKYLAETWLLFSGELKKAGSNRPRLNEVVDQMYRHYVINTPGPIPESAREVTSADVDENFNVFQEAAEYAKIVGVELRNAADQFTLLLFNGQSVRYPVWGIIPGKTAAFSLRKVGPVINRTRYGRDDVIPSFLFGFDETASHYSLENAMVMADFSQLAYLQSSYVRQQLAQWGYGNFEWFHDEKSDTQAFIAAKDGHVVVCFRGTASKTDWITDIKLFMTNSEAGNGKVHLGFKSALDSVWPRISQRLKTYGQQQKRIFFTGHSLGAALAQMAAYRHAVTGARQVGGIYVFGSPRLGNSTYKASYDGLLGAKSFLHINNTDMVPQVPLRLLGYRHLGTNIFRFNLGHELRAAADSERIQARQVTQLQDLDPQTQEEVRAMLAAAANSVTATTRFLRLPPQQLEEVTYSTTFERGRIDDHGMEQYLFKLGCAIVDGKYDRMRGQ